ncbi:sigma-70 family RNA polymerase sigma factor [bacterium]|nr:sigma-70 family RNA polymerase sigma factor [bacterium]
MNKEELLRKIDHLALQREPAVTPAQEELLNLHRSVHQSYEKYLVHAGEQNLINYVGNFLASQGIVHQVCQEMNGLWKMGESLFGEFLEGVLKNARHPKVLMTEPGFFSKKVKDIASNYNKHGILVDHLLGVRRTAGMDKHIQEIHLYFRNVAMKKFRLNEDRAEDAVQNAWCQIMINLRDYYFGSSFETWCIKVLINTHLMRIRSEGTVRRGGDAVMIMPDAETETGHADWVRLNVSDASENPEQIVIHKELRDKIEREIDDFLDEFQGENREETVHILKKHFLEQEKLKTLTDQYQIPYHRVHQVCARLKAHLQTVIE